MIGRSTKNFSPICCDLFDTAGWILNSWRLATTLAGMETGAAEWRRARDALIDAGLMLVVEK